MYHYTTDYIDDKSIQLSTMEKKKQLFFDHIRIRKIREVRNLSQTTLAKQLGMSQSSYNDLEQGRTKLRAETLLLLTTHLRVDIRCFFQNDLPIAEQIKLVDEKEELERECFILREENERLKVLLHDRKQVHLAYQKKSEELSSNMSKELKTKEFWIKILLLFGISIISIFIFTIYYAAHGK